MARLDGVASGPTWVARSGGDVGALGGAAGAEKRLHEIGVVGKDRGVAYTGARELTGHKGQPVDGFGEAAHREQQLSERQVGVRRDEVGAHRVEQGQRALRVLGAALLVALGGVDPRDGAIDARCPNGGCWIAVLQPEISDGAYGAFWVTARGNRAINLQGERLPINQGLTLAHEIGHAWAPYRIAYAS